MNKLMSITGQSCEIIIQYINIHINNVQFIIKYIYNNSNKINNERSKIHRSSIVQEHLAHEYI